MRTYTNEIPSFRVILKKLVETPQDFTPEDFRLVLDCLFTPNLIPPEHVGVFLTAAHLHRIERRPELLATAASLLRKRALDVVIEGDEKDFVVDIVGTGGDGHNLFNVSTTAGIVAAGAGARVVKHGNKASTSSSGSADLLQALGCRLSRPPTSHPDTVPIIPRIPFSFLLAPHYHPILQSITSYRKSIPFRTIFNLLGPLISPARPRGMVVGVPQPELGLAFAQALHQSGVARALVVCGQEGIDEISCAGPTWIWELRDERITTGVISPKDFGLDTHPLEDVKGGNAGDNAETLRALLTDYEGEDGLGLGPVQRKAVLDFVLMNASALLVTAGLVDSYIEGVRLARVSVISGKAWSALETFRKECGRTGVLH